MSGVAVHHCPGSDDDGRELRPAVVTCGICHRSWCERCDPAPSALCHWCHGRGRSLAPIPPRQAPGPAYEYEVQGLYSYGWECVTTEATRADVLAQVACYRANEPGTAFRVRRVRVTA